MAPALLAALHANPKLARVRDGTVTVLRLTSADALVAVAKGGERWRVYLKKADRGWVVKNAKRIAQ
ncbi:MAG: hypothetical protein H5T86_15190 [Armatimonadetes bacterium]|nr:hypothetical protein [Armatimonadota bacterium]